MVDRTSSTPTFLTMQTKYLVDIDRSLLRLAPCFCPPLRLKWTKLHFQTRHRVEPAQLCRQNVTSALPALLLAPPGEQSRSPTHRLRQGLRDLRSYIQEKRTRRTNCPCKTIKLWSFRPTVSPTALPPCLACCPLARGAHRLSVENESCSESCDLLR